MDYKNLCYCLELSSEEKIVKVIVCGGVEVIKDDKITFEGKDANDVNVYVVEEE